MAKVFHCKTIGLDCGATVRGETEGEVMRQAREHARAEHGMADLTPEMEAGIRRGIHDEGEDGCPDCCE